LQTNQDQEPSPELHRVNKQKAADSRQKEQKIIAVWSFGFVEKGMGGGIENTIAGRERRIRKRREG
jgi:hypothetical protein